MSTKKRKTQETAMMNKNSLSVGGQDENLALAALDMPPKRRSIKGQNATSSADAECQTDYFDEEFAKDLQKINDLKRGEAGSNEGSSTPSISRSPQVLLFQLKACMRIVSKLSTDLQKSKRENERIVSFFSEIFRLVRVMRSDYDSTLVNVQDNIKAMEFDLSRYIGEVTEHLNKQKSIMEEERKRFKNGLKNKDVQIEHLSEKLIESREHIKTVMQALEAQQRLITIAERDAHAAREECKGTNRKLNDQLYLVGNQRCVSCQANEKIREMLSNEVAEKTNEANNWSQKYMELESVLQEQRRVNEILSRSVNKHAFSEKAYKSEFERVKADYETILCENKTLKSRLSALNYGGGTAAIASALSTTITSTSTVVNTPPDSSSDKSSKDDTSAANDGAPLTDHISPNNATSLSQQRLTNNNHTFSSKSATANRTNLTDSFSSTKKITKTETCEQTSMANTGFRENHFRNNNNQKQHQQGNSSSSLLSVRDSEFSSSAHKTVEKDREAATAKPFEKAVPKKPYEKTSEQLKSRTSSSPLGNSLHLTQPPRPPSSLGKDFPTSAKNLKPSSKNLEAGEIMSEDEDDQLQKSTLSLELKETSKPKCGNKIAFDNKSTSSSSSSSSTSTSKSSTTTKTSSSSSIAANGKTASAARRAVKRAAMIQNSRMLSVSGAAVASGPPEATSLLQKKRKTWTETGQPLSSTTATVAAEGEDDDDIEFIEVRLAASTENAADVKGASSTRVNSAGSSTTDIEVKNECPDVAASSASGDKSLCGSSKSNDVSDDKKSTTSVCNNRRRKGQSPYNKARSLIYMRELEEQRLREEQRRRVIMEQQQRAREIEAMRLRDEREMQLRAQQQKQMMMQMREQQQGPQLQRDFRRCNGATIDDVLAMDRMNGIMRSGCGGNIVGGRGGMPLQQQQALALQQQQQQALAMQQQQQIGREEMLRHQSMAAAHHLPHPPRPPACMPQPPEPPNFRTSVGPNYNLPWHSGSANRIPNGGMQPMMPGGPNYATAPSNFAGNNVWLRDPYSRR